MIVVKGNNVGPFTEFSIEIPRIAIVSGISASGKTYLLKLIYTLVQALNSCWRQKRCSGRDFVEALQSISRSMLIDIPRHGADAAHIELEVDGDTIHVVYPSQGEPRCIDTTLLYKVRDLYTLLLPEDRLIVHRYLQSYVFQIFKTFIFELAYRMIDLIEQIRRIVIEKERSDKLNQLLEYTRSRIPSEVQQILQHIPRNILELSFEMIENSFNKDIMYETCSKINDVLEKHKLGKLVIVESESGGIYLAKTLYEHPTGYRIDIDRAPEAIANLWISLLPIVGFVHRYSGFKIVLIDHVEMHSTPPITKYLLHTILDYAKDRDDVYLVITVHNIDTLTLVSETIREIFGNEVDRYVVAYEILHDGKIRRLDIDPRLGIETPKYLDEYMSMLAKAISL